MRAALCNHPLEIDAHQIGHIQFMRLQRGADVSTTARTLDGIPDGPRGDVVGRTGFRHSRKRLRRP